MFDFIAENLANIIVGAIVFSAVAAVVVKSMKDRKSNKNSCGCSCAGCPSARKCGYH